MKKNLFHERRIDRNGLEYKEKSVLITGGSQGIGLGCARVFAEAGANVVICARRADVGEQAAAEIREKGGDCVFVACDVNKEDDIKNAVEFTVQRNGKLDLLLNNAGYHPGFHPVDDYSVSDFTKLIQTNLVSYYISIKYALPHIRKARGNIINMGSLTGQFGQEGSCIYAAVKGAIASLTKSLAIEEGRYGVRVNCVSPGNIITQSRLDNIDKFDDGAYFDNLCDRWQPNGCSGYVEEVGHVCLFLASDLASYVTGIDFIVSGGSELGYGAKYPLLTLEHTVGLTLGQMFE